MHLIIDTCGPDLRIFLLTAQKLLFVNEKDFLRKSEVLATKVSELIVGANKAVSDLKTIAVVIGPGAFIGSRAGVLFAKTLAMLLKQPLWTITSLAFEPIFEELITIQEHSWEKIAKNFSKISVGDVHAVSELYAKDPKIGGA